MSEQYAGTYRLRPMTLGEVEATMRDLDENIADMTATANRIGENDGWHGELYEGICADLARWRAQRERLAVLRRMMRSGAIWNVA